MTDRVTAPATPAPAAPAAAQAPAPAAPLPGVPAPAAPAPEPAAAAPAPATPEPDLAAAGFESTDDAGLNLALRFVASKGLKADDPAIQAARDGDFALLKAKLSTMGDKATGWQEHIALAEAAYERAQAQATARNAEVEKAVFSVVGGKEQWDTIAAWAGQQATPEEKAQINAALAAGGIQAKAAAKYLLDVFTASGQAPSKAPANPAKDNAAGGSPAGSGALTARQYADAVQALSAKHGGRDVSNLPEYRQLQAARVAGRKRGI